MQDIFGKPRLHTQLLRTTWLLQATFCKEKSKQEAAPHLLPIIPALCVFSNSSALSKWPEARLEARPWQIPLPSQATHFFPEVHSSVGFLLTPKQSDISICVMLTSVIPTFRAEEGAEAPGSRQAWATW